MRHQLCIKARMMWDPQNTGIVLYVTSQQCRFNHRDIDGSYGSAMGDYIITLIRNDTGELISERAKVGSNTMC